MGQNNGLSAVNPLLSITRSRSDLQGPPLIAVTSYARRRQSPFDLIATLLDQQRESAGRRYSDRLRSEAVAHITERNLILLFTNLLTITLTCQRFLHAFLFTRFQVERVTLDFLDNVFGLHLALKAPQGILKGFAFLYSNLCQEKYTSKQSLSGTSNRITRFAIKIPINSWEINGVTAQNIDNFCDYMHYFALRFAAKT